MNLYYPVSLPDIGPLEKEYAKKAIDSTWISSKGEYIHKFQSAWAAYNGMLYGVVCNSGTSALYLAFKALGLGVGNEVIVPDFTMVATAWAVSQTGATPVFVDCDDTLNIDPKLIEAKVTKNTKAICVVHVYGRRVNMPAIMAIAKKHNLKVIEDSAEAHGIKPVGDVACFSFFGNKIITTGEGGMCVTNNATLATEIHLLANMYFDPGHTFLHPKMGHNFRMTNVEAAIGLAQVERIDELLAKRKQIETWYDKRLPDEIRMPARDVLWMYDVNLGKYRDAVKRNLSDTGIDSRVFFKPMTMQPMYVGWGGSPVAERWSKAGIYLPTYPALLERDVDCICYAIINSLRSAKEHELFVQPGQVI